MKIINVLLLLIAIILIMILAPISFFYTICKKIFNHKINISNYIFRIAVKIDIFGNYVCKFLLNDFLIKDNNNIKKYEFGKNETISNVVGKNLLLGTLTPIGKLLNYILNTIEKNHTTKYLKQSELLAIQNIIDNS